MHALVLIPQRLQNDHMEVAALARQLGFTGLLAQAHRSLAEASASLCLAHETMKHWLEAAVHAVKERDARAHVRALVGVAETWCVGSHVPTFTHACIHTVFHSFMHTNLHLKSIFSAYFNQLMHMCVVLAACATIHFVQVCMDLSALHRCVHACINCARALL